jgi:hypothetical protein
MKRIGYLALALIAAAVRPAATAELPAKITYLFFVQGKPAGRSDVAITLRGGVYTISSSQDVGFADYRQKLSCRTELDGRTLRERSFHFEGVRQGEAVSGTVQAEGDSARGKFESKGVPYTGKTAWNDATFFFENYVPEHLVLIGRHIAASTKLQTKFAVVFPSDMITLPGTATAESEIEVPAKPAPIICTKYVIGFQNAAPFYLFVDPERNIPVYMVFPATQTEIFLMEAFGENPTPNYLAPSAP